MRFVPKPGSSRTAAAVAACAVAAGLMHASAVTRAQQAPASGQTFVAGTDVVLVDVLVTRGDSPVPGLTVDNFTVNDNGVAQTVRLVDLTSLPVGLLLVLDTSGSVNGAPLDQLKAAAHAAVGNLRPTDQAAVLTFSQNLALASDWTADRAAVTGAIDAVTARGATALADAAYAGLAMRRPAGLRTLMLLFTDGEDTASWLTADQAVEAARRSEAVVYAADASPGGGALLATLAKETGGESVQVADAAGLQKVFADAVSRFNQRYVLAYVPTGVDPAGWHDLVVRVSDPDLQVVARRGYRR